MKLGIDLDGVVIDGMAGLIEWTKAKYGIEFTAEDVVRHDAVIAGRKIGELFDEAYADPQMVLGLKPVPGALLSLDVLATGGHDVTFITHRPNFTKAATTLWLHDMVGFQPVEFCHGSSKAAFGVDILVDDHFKSLVEVTEAGGLGIVFTQPWNRNVELPKHVARADDWGTVLELIFNAEDGQRW